jgi:hypothetical protein
MNRPSGARAYTLADPESTPLRRANSRRKQAPAKKTPGKRLLAGLHLQSN